MAAGGNGTTPTIPVSASCASKLGEVLRILGAPADNSADADGDRPALWVVGAEHAPRQAEHPTGRGWPGNAAAGECAAVLSDGDVGCSHELIAP
jgi:hypothetical protein